MICGCVANRMNSVFQIRAVEQIYLRFCLNRTVAERGKSLPSSLHVYSLDKSSSDTLLMIRDALLLISFWIFSLRGKRDGDAEMFLCSATRPPPVRGGRDTYVELLK